MVVILKTPQTLDTASVGLLKRKSLADSIRWMTADNSVKGKLPLYRTYV